MLEYLLAEHLPGCDLPKLDLGWLDPYRYSPLCNPDFEVLALTTDTPGLYTFSFLHSSDDERQLYISSTSLVMLRPDRLNEEIGFYLKD